MINDVNKNESERLAAIKQQKIAEKFSIYLACARDEGREEGREKVIRASILSMHKNGCDAETIARLLELPLEKVEGILSSK